MDALLSLIPGGSLTAILAVVAAALAAFWRTYVAGRRSGENEAKAKEARSHERELEDVGRAHDARNRVDAGGLPDDDKYRRD